MKNFNKLTKIQKGREAIFSSIMDGLEVSDYRIGDGGAYTDEMQHMANGLAYGSLWSNYGRTELVRVELDGMTFEITVTRKK